MYFAVITGGVDSYSLPLADVSFTGATVLWKNRYAARNATGYKNFVNFMALFIQPTSSTVVMTITSSTAATDRRYEWNFYPYE